MVIDHRAAPFVAHGEIQVPFIVQPANNERAVRVGKFLAHFD